MVIIVKSLESSFSIYIFLTQFFTLTHSLFLPYNIFVSLDLSCVSGKFSAARQSQSRTQKSSSLEAKEIDRKTQYLKETLGKKHFTIEINKSDIVAYNLLVFL